MLKILLWVIAIVCIVSYLGGKNGNLYKSKRNRMICGVCGGIGERMNIDPTIVRLLWVIFILAGGSGVFAYLIFALVMPER